MERGVADTCPSSVMKYPYIKHLQRERVNLNLQLQVCGPLAGTSDTWKEPVTHTSMVSRDLSAYRRAYLCSASSPHHTVQDPKGLSQNGVRGKRRKPAEHWEFPFPVNGMNGSASPDPSAVMG